MSEPHASPAPAVTSPGSLAELLWIYAYAYTAAHDFAVSDRIMVDDYVLHMGEHEIRGRADEYQPATHRQYAQYPTLGFTVHRLITNGERAALHFTEHGRSIHGGREAAWQGVSLYRWSPEVGRLTECRVEQDYFARRIQLSTGRPQPIRPPGIDPWSTEERAPDNATEDIARRWLTSGDWLTSLTVAWDDGGPQAQWESVVTEVLDLFSAGSSVAFHARLTGEYAGGLPETEGLIGQQGDLFVTGLIDVENTITGRLVSDRHSMTRRLANR